MYGKMNRIHLASSNSENWNVPSPPI